MVAASPTGGALILGGFLLGACVAPLDDDDTLSGDDDTLSGDDDTLSDDDDDSSVLPVEGPCPDGMVLVEDGFCIDRYEAALQEADGAGSWLDASPYEVVAGREVRAVLGEGLVPQSYISGEEAAQACAASGKRLCSSDEWLSACQGTQDFLYPYGDIHVPGACNDSYPGTHPVVDFFGTADGVWDAEHMNDPGINQQPGTVEPAGAHSACRSSWDVFDLHGNLHEWVADPEGVFRGGFYADAVLNGAGCTYATTAHAVSYHDYSTGFRCCSDPAP